MPREMFRNIGLVARAGGEQALYSVRQLVHFLQQRGCHIIIEHTLQADIGDLGLQAGTRKQLAQSCDLVIVVGGDGSLLGAARTFAGFDVPLLGINRGRLGFLTDILPSELETRVGQVLDGEYTTEYRFLLDMEVRRRDAIIGRGSALNDVVLLSGDSVHMVEFELFIDGLFVYKQRSDGLIISTPTGSTAYALSGGGPIMHPRLDAIVLVPLNPHTLTSRPLVVDGNSDIRLRVTTHRLHPLVSCDGQDGVRVQLDDEIRLGKKPQRLKLLHPPGHDFYEACRSKLGWSSRLGDA
ncbi:NAD(+) kinase [Alcanivorax quisquiliarum]|uniref:NAD kinase n=1 Tax=Alcanivorax quisquiliarum TaxID=2933565 RepID=A0ABT0E3Z8_9GAMM|nr:NAD(+) kinase [Alcanivorax quisquiliarum]